MHTLKNLIVSLGSVKSLTPHSWADDLSPKITTAHVPWEKQLREVCKGAAGNGSLGRMQVESGHGKPYQETEQVGFTQQTCNVDKRLMRLSLALRIVHSWSWTKNGNHIQIWRVLTVLT